MAYCLDTNVLLRSVHSTHALHTVAIGALRHLATNREQLCIFPQNVREFWNVATRPVERNGLGFSVAQAETEVARIEAAFTLLEDGLAVYHGWRNLVAKYQVSGVQVHDCYLAAAVRVRKVEWLLTFDSSDFARYGINVVDPATI